MIEKFKTFSKINENLSDDVAKEILSENPKTDKFSDIEIIALEKMLKSYKLEMIANDKMIFIKDIYIIKEKSSKSYKIFDKNANQVVWAPDFLILIDNLNNEGYFD